ncbi:hypothetical protein [Thioalkalivibrio sp.]|uniref:hypothetical protein n=1 Tax=Thioalkalivibrio sp. TaxID=2093813 RepID=UPI00356297E1
MTGYRSFSDSMLHAFVDAQLEGADRERLLTAMESDADLRDRVHELRRSKEWVQLAFEDIRAPARPAHRGTAARRGWIRPSHAVAASLLLGLGGFLTGWFVQEIQRPGHALAGAVLAAQEEAGSLRVVLHIDRSDAEGFVSILDEAERLFASGRGTPVAVDVLANAGGLDLLRTSVSPHAERIAEMSREYENLRFLACANSIERLREQGIEPVLVKEADTSTTAVDHIVDRLHRGWTYIGT